MFLFADGRTRNRRCSRLGPWTRSRRAVMVGCTFFVFFGALSGSVGTFILYLLFLPINAIRLRQMLKLINRARIATEGDTSLEWLKPFMTERNIARATNCAARAM